LKLSWGGESDDRSNTKAKRQHRYHVEAEVINPDIFAGKTTSEIEQFDRMAGSKNNLLFASSLMLREVQGVLQQIRRIIVRGDVPRVKHIGHGMKAGEIMIEAHRHACRL